MQCAPCRLGLCKLGGGGSWHALMSMIPPGLAKNSALTSLGNVVCCIWFRRSQTSVRLHGGAARSGWVEDVTEE